MTGMIIYKNNITGAVIIDKIIMIDRIVVTGTVRSRNIGGTYEHE
jgi:hypothetical protein